jgi:hypothetical protein
MLTQPVIVSAERPSATMDLLHAQVAAAAAAPMVRSGAEQDRLIPVVPSLQRSNLRAVN